MTRNTSGIRVGFVLHSMHVAGAEMLVSEIIARSRGRLDPVVFCLDRVGTLGESLAAAGIPVICFDRRPGLDASLPWRLAAECRRLGIRLLHAHQYTPFFYAAVARLISRLNVKLVLTEHGRHYPDIVSRRRRWANRWLLARQADAINACCQFSADALSTNDWFPSQLIEVIRNGIEIKRYQLPSERSKTLDSLNLNSARRYVGTIARLHSVKDHATLLSAFRVIATTVPDVDLILAGDGPLREELEARASEYGIRDRVHFLGIRRDVPQLLQTLDVFVLPSLSEAASLTVLEAMASGVPVVTTAVGGNPEMITSLQHGLLVPREDPDQLAAAVLSLLSDPTLAARLADEAINRVLQEYRLEDTIDAHIAVYTRLLGRTVNS